MKIGAEQKGKVAALGALLAVALMLLLRSIDFGGAAAGAAAAPAKVAIASLRAGNLDPMLHLERLDQLRAIQYQGTGRDLFHFGAAPPPVAVAGRGGPGGGPAAAAAALPAGPVTPPPPPPPPPIPLKFFGFADSSGAPETIFLQMGDASYVVEEGDTIEHRYLIEKIGKLSVRVKDLQTQQEQELPLQQGG